ncbi:MAG: glycosyltransferase family 4 protein [Nevskia sp.]|nr:glycosyltransferase family 4 protein [Nevskia sp.]
MRIIQVNSHLHGGGVDSQTLELCAGLLEQGHEVLLAVNEGARWMPRAEALRGLRIETVAAAKLGWGLRLRRLAESFQAQVLHAHHGRDYWTTGLACKLAANRPRAVLTRHLMTPLSATSARFLLRLGHVTAVSRAVQEHLAQQLSGDLRRLHLVYAGVDTRRFRPDPAARAAARQAYGWDESQVLFAVVGGAGLPDGKGQREFVEAGARLIRERPEVKLLIVGEGSLIPVLQQRIAELGLERSILTVGFSEDVERIDAMIDVLVHPAVGTEALGLVIWEAMAAGKPVIASRLGGIPETFVEPDHGRLVQPRSVDELYAAMSLFAADRGLRERAGAAAREYILANDYTRAGQARRFAALYQSIQPKTRTHV